MMSDWHHLLGTYTGVALLTAATAPLAILLWAWPVLTDIRDQELVLRKDVHHGVHGQEEAEASSFVRA